MNQNLWLIIKWNASQKCREHLKDHKQPRNMGSDRVWSGAAREDGDKEKVDLAEQVVGHSNKPIKDALSP